MEEFLLQYLSEELVVFMISMFPIVELRGAIPVGVALGLEWHTAYLLSVLGNIVPIPFIIWFFRPIIEYLEKTKMFGKLATKLKKRTHSKMNDVKLNKYKLLGLYIFVAIPLPGTGAWTGAAIAALMKMRIKYAFLVITAGVASAGVIMLTVSKLGEYIINLI